MEPVQQDVYVDNLRTDVEPFIPPSARSALDVGCGAGGFGLTLRRVLGPEARIVGVESVASQAAAARVGHGFDEVVQGYFPAAMGGDERFDVIFFNDVLEHILDPWEVLRQTSQFLFPGGRVVAAIPSIQYAPVVFKLLKGRWDYVDQGTLDRTHVRFFTRATMIELFRDCGLEVESCTGANTMGRRWAASSNPLLRLAARIVPLPFGPMAYVHFIVVGRPVSGGQPPA